MSDPATTSPDSFTITLEPLGCSIPAQGATVAVRVDDPAVEAFWRGSIDYAFAVQDKPMIEAQQAILGDRHVDDLNPVAIPADVAGAKARRMLARLIAAEQRGEERVRPGGEALAKLLAQSANSAAPVLPVV